MGEEGVFSGGKQVGAWDIPYRGDKYALRREVSVDVECICSLANRTEECVCGSHNDKDVDQGRGNRTHNYQSKQRRQPELPCEAR